MLDVQSSDACCRLLDAAMAELLANGGSLACARRWSAAVMRKLSIVCRATSSTRCVDASVGNGCAGPSDSCSCSLIFKFDDVTSLDQAARTALFDEIPTERVILALKGANAQVREAVLSVSGSAGEAHGRERAVGRHECARPRNTIGPAIHRRGGAAAVSSGDDQSSRGDGARLAWETAACLIRPIRKAGNRRRPRRS